MKFGGKAKEVKLRDFVVDFSEISERRLICDTALNSDSETR